MPAAVSTGDTKVEHGLGVVGLPPCTGEFETLLNDVAMSAFDLARTDGQARIKGGLIVELAGTIGEIAIACAHRGLIGRYSLRFLKRCKDRCDERQAITAVRLKEMVNR